MFPVHSSGLIVPSPFVHKAGVTRSVVMLDATNAKAIFQFYGSLDLNDTSSEENSLTGTGFIMIIPYFLIL